MSSQSVDICKLTVDDIFRAKEERRRRLAKLPFEEKIKIVERLRTVVDAIKGERVIFKSFLKTCPHFAGEPIEEWDVVEDWYTKRALPTPAHPFDKRPDIIARTASGKKIGVELKSWVNREQIGEARRVERIQDNIRRAIEQQGPNETLHIGQVWLLPKEVRFDPHDAVDFLEQLLVLVKGEDKPELDDSTWLDVEVIDYPTLRKYLKSVRVFSKRRHRSRNWITFPYSASHFSPNTMRETLKKALTAHIKDERYKDLNEYIGLDESYLLVHYDFKAFAYNTPFDAPNFGFREAAKFASGVLDGDGGNFDRVFLFQFLWGKEEAYRIVPSEFEDGPDAVTD